jgi:hypothetical protein
MKNKRAIKKPFKRLGIKSINSHLTGSTMGALEFRNELTLKKAHDGYAKIE